ncbi:DotA/TraY family protein [Shinella sumterensis]|jgi:conjugal transfer/type IV secretion protein DotA/TraY|uniref:DotA/TraY family protein n=1 Tax=Shinella sumterensis TaxID=1967501 RepID=A0AA50CST1_9HYPH|nr:DotA/TraY family protein [Shinella sumterensis]WLS01379.1 DotA/TraY family protein [Shinella sumterensis]
MKKLVGASVTWFLSASFAMADEINIADIITGEGDARTKSLLNMIFGPLFEGPNDETIISNLIVSFNILFFAVGALLIIYNIVVGVTETAHEGEVLGRGHSSMWVPIRTVLAAAALVPMPTGYNASQHVIAYTVNVGTAAASFFWNETVDLVVNQKLPVVGGDFESLDGQFIQALWRMELCQAVYNEEVAKGGSGLDGVSRSWSVRSGVTQMAYSLPSSYGACGIVSLPGHTSGFQRLAESAGKTYADYTNGMKQAVETTANRFTAKAGELAQAVSKRTTLPAYADLREELSQWRNLHFQITRQYIGNERLQAAGKELAETDEPLNVTPVGDEQSIALAGNLTAGGWLQSGFYYQLISRLSADSNSVATAMPTTTPGGAIGAASSPSGGVRNAIASQYAANSWYLWGSADGDAKKFLEQISATYNGTVEWWNESVARSGIRAFVNERVAFADSGGEISDWMPSAGSLYEAFNFLNPTSPANDPMIGLISFGTKFTFYSMAVIAALSLLSAVPFVGGAISVFTGFVGWIISGIGVVGMFLAFVLPMVPTVTWVIGVTAFFLLVIEAVFAAPLWAIAHLSLEGKGMSGSQARRGYVLVLALIATPMLMLFGLLIGMIIFRIAGVLINGGLYYALTSAQSLVGDSHVSLAWFVGVFVVMMFMSVVYLVIIERSFSLISEFPGRIFRWFDEIGSDLDSGTVMRSNAATLGMGHRLEKSVDPTKLLPARQK